MPPIRLTIITASPQPRDLAVPEPRAGRIPAEMPCVCGFLRPGKPGGRTFDRVGPPPVLKARNGATSPATGTPSKKLLVQELRGITGTAGKHIEAILHPPSSRRAVLKQLVQDGVESRGILVQLFRLGLLSCALLEQLVGNVEGGEDRDLRERRHRQPSGDLAHLA